MALIQPTPAQLNQIKRINQRLAQMEKTGYQDTGIYNALITRINSSGLKTTTTKDGNLRLSRAKTQQSGNGLFTFEQNLDFIESAPKLADELRKAKNEDYFPIGKTAKERVINKANFEERLNDHLQEMYDDADRGNMYGEMLRNMVKTKGLRKESYSTISDIMDKIDETREALISEGVPYQRTLFEEANNDNTTTTRRGIPSSWLS